MKPPEPLSRQDLLAIQAGNKRNADVKALLWEIKRLQGVLEDVEGLRKLIDAGWKEEVGGGFAALHVLRNLLANEVQSVR